MSVETVRGYLTGYGKDKNILEFDVSSATVALAAEALSVSPARIAKTLAFKESDRCLLVVAAGDVKIDNAKYKKQFGCKAKMLSSEETFMMTGHAVGGVCPFAVPGDIPIYLDTSLQRFTTVFPACGSANSAIELSPEEIFRIAKARSWVNVTKIRE